MLFIFGITPKIETVGRGRGVCLSCGRAVDFHISKKQSALSLFFIPIIRFGTAYRVKCPKCGGVMALSKEKGKDLEHDNRSMIYADDLEVVEKSAGPICPSCGAKIIVNQNFCYQCGAKL